MKKVEKYLPEYISPSKDLHDLETRINWIRQQLLNNHVDRGETLEEEKMLVNQYNKVYIEHEETIIKNAKVVICTLQTAMRNSLLKLIRKHHFSVVCVDEAGFCSDSQLLPVIFHSARLIMAGDHLQLPPVVLSDQARDRGLGVSLMERLASQCPQAVSLLTVQYRYIN